MPTPDLCNSAQWQDEIQVISGDVFDKILRGPGDYNRILVEQNPAWTDFRQDAHGEMRNAGVIFHETAFGPELGTGVNPAVLLVTYGVEQDWELPENGDLISEVDSIRAVLYQRYLEWFLGEVDRSQYPPIANAPTYALYRYFNGDLSRLEAWCRTYVEVYHQPPVR